MLKRNDYCTNIILGNIYAVLNVSRRWFTLTSTPIISIGSQTDVNTKVKMTRQDNGTDGVLVVAIILVKIAEVHKSIPIYWATNIIATLYMIIVPSLLIVAPKQI